MKNRVLPYLDVRGVTRFSVSSYRKEFEGHYLGENPVSESAKDRTKRTFCEYMNLCTWKYQYSFFHNDFDVAKEFAITDGQILRKVLGRKFKDQPFLYRLCLNSHKQESETVNETTGEITLVNEKSILLPYHMFFTTRKLPEGALSDAINYCMDGELNCMYRPVRPAKLQSYRSAVKVQEPHNLKRFFGDRKINRISLLNQKAIESS